MSQPPQTYQIVDQRAWDELSGSGVAMLALLDGFIDAGQVARSLSAHLVATAEPTRLVTFDVDSFHDYRSRRPRMVFDQDRWAEVDLPDLGIDRVHDTTGRPFLLLRGPEPDMRWQAFLSSLFTLIDEVGVSAIYTAHGIPMAVPHTRPLQITRHATRPELVKDTTRIGDRIEVPAGLVSLLELMAGRRGLDALGYAVHVPHYLAQIAYPTATLTALRALEGDTGLVLSRGELEAEETETRTRIDEQVAADQETTEVVTALERAFDLAVSAEAQMPTAEEIGAEFERFLAEREKDDGGHA